MPTTETPLTGEAIARSLVPHLLKLDACPEIKDSLPLWWSSLMPNTPQSIRSLRFEKAIDSFRASLKEVEKGDDDSRKCQVREALSEIMWKDLSSFSDNREPERTRLTFSWLFEILTSWSDDVEETDKVNEFFVNFHLDTSAMRYNTGLSLVIRERCTQSSIEALSAFRPIRSSMIGLVRLLRIETYASLIQLASERAIQCWSLKLYKDARQTLLVHESAIAYAADLERNYEEVITERTDRRATKWMEGLNKLVHAVDETSGYEYSFGRIAEAAADCRAYIRKCEARNEIDLGLKLYNQALMDDPAKIVEGVEDAQSHFRNAAITAADCDWNLEGEALVHIAATLAKVFRRADSARILYQRAIHLVNAHNGKKFAKWYEKARQALLGEEQIEAEANEARWAGIRAAVEDRLAEHLKPIEEHEGDFPAFINWIWKTYPPLSTGGTKLPEDLFKIEEVIIAPARKRSKQGPIKKTVNKISDSAFRKLVLRYHPDKGQERFGEVWKQTAETIVKQLNSRRDKHKERYGEVAA